MGKPRIYGMKRTAPKSSQCLDRYWKRKLKQQRQRESTMSKQVAAQLRKEKEPQA